MYQQKNFNSPGADYDDSRGTLRGGTNLVAFNAEDGVQTFVGFPKSNVHLGCNDHFYRPSILVLTAASPNFCRVDYISTSIEFGDQALSPNAKRHPCGEGRITMANSIADWERSAGKDLMTITYTVDDVTMQILRIHGLEVFVNSVLDRSRFGRGTPKSTARVDLDSADSQWSEAGYNVLSCSVQAAEDYALLSVKDVGGPDLRARHLEGAAKESAVADAKTSQGCYGDSGS